MIRSGAKLKAFKMATILNLVKSNLLAQILSKGSALAAGYDLTMYSFLALKTNQSF